MNPIETAVKFIVGMVLVAFLLVASSLFMGTILWLLWPVTAVAVWGLPAMGWWQCVCGLWTLAILASAFKAKVEMKG